ncbi:DUF6402 family protein [Ralstonia solanacearum]|uniref:DUF6402 family protein n=1 Tax=Ralstonia solanacearum TaxID=305 RepID=UPI0012DAB977|nr:DUF6402 family protein [Ralstonia solanacearum]
MDKLPTPMPGWKPPEPPKVEKPKPARDEKQETLKPAPDKKKGKPPAPPPKPDDKSKNPQAEEDCRTPPPFDMLDLPGAMEKMGFYVAAKVARRWFNGRAHILGKRTDPYPSDMVDTTTVSLGFTLKYGKSKEKYDKLISEDIYTDNAKAALTATIQRFIENKFLNEGKVFTGEIDTLALSGGDMQKLHSSYQFQLATVNNLDTLDDKFGMTDLTATLGNFFFMAAIANAKVYTEQYYRYDQGDPVYCCQSKVDITHIHVYARDSYSFADKPGKTSSQYLGHWNRYGVILVPSATAADVLNNVTGSKGTDLQWGDSADTPGITPYVYENGFKKPVDIIKGFFRTLRKQDVYYPIHNSDYSAWRRKFNRGGDFAIYTEPKKIKLPKPIQFTLEEICRPAKQAESKRSPGK